MCLSQRLLKDDLGIKGVFSTWLSSFGDNSKKHLVLSRLIFKSGMPQDSVLGPTSDLPNKTLVVWKAMTFLKFM